ncbi:MAG: N-6 DNA methylase, partial [Nanoarchaeota archaeon]|nr:N-6 DNA methylase [Nanoarchaeota archaeon]
VEDYRNLYKLAEKKEIYKNLFNIFRIADDRYNSGIFNFQKDKISPNINIDDKVLKSILLHLYYPESPYEFSVLPADILGNIYEQFLGKTIRLTPSHQAKVEEKPEVRKAGGVYYTPKYIVDYIVKNTVGEKIKGKTPRQISKITICDPACGSGSFLIQAYQYLLNYHLGFYQKDIKKYKDKIIQISENSYQLTTQEKKRILLNNVYGVDIDPQAVEVTKLSLLLKVLEGENRETLQSQLKLFHERALPNLSNNIKCGNSLIGTDYYDNVDMSLFGSEEMRKINAFDWEKEFPQIFHRGDAKHAKKYNKNKKLSDLCDSALNTGFDVVIGNPPYVSSKEVPKFEKLFFRKRYETAISQFDLYTIFIEKGIRLLCKDGLFSYIIPDAILDRSSAYSLRKFILTNSKINTLVHIKGVFEDPSVASVIIVLKNNQPTGENEISFYKYKTPDDFFNQKYKYENIKQKRYKSIKNYSFVFLSNEDFEIIEKIRRGKVLFGNISFMGRGEELGKSSSVISSSRNRSSFGILYGEDIQRYLISFNQRYIDSQFVKKNMLLYARKIVVRQIGDDINASFDEVGFVTIQSIYTIIPNKDCNIKYILGLLNSSLMNYVYTKLYRSKKLFPRILLENLRDLPIHIIDFLNSSEKQIHNTLVSLVDQMLSAKKQYHSAKIERDKKLYKQKIDILDRKIDGLVYKLYDLTDEEIKIVEEFS